MQKISVKTQKLIQLHSELLDMISEFDRLDAKIYSIDEKLHLHRQSIEILNSIDIARVQCHSSEWLKTGNIQAVQYETTKQVELENERIASLEKRKAQLIERGSVVWKAIGTLNQKIESLEAESLESDTHDERSSLHLTKT